MRVGRAQVDVFGSQAIVASVIALAGGALVIAAAALCYHIQAPRSPWRA